MFPSAASGQIRRWAPGRAVDLRVTLSALSRGAGDPTSRIAADGSIWRTTRLASGPATMHLAVTPPDGGVVATAWGPGADEALAGVPALLGAADDCTGFAPQQEPLRALWARYGRGWRVPASGRVMEALIPAVLEQKVTGHQARRSWGDLVRAYGEPAPGPAPRGMRVCPPARVWAGIPSWDWHRAGVDSKRAATIVAAARVAGRLEETCSMMRDEAVARLRTVPGVGAWTVAEVRQRAHGDADAVSVGDFHIPKLVGWSLLGRPVDDAAMLELLAPYAGHRYRVVRLLELSGKGYPRFGPRYAPQDMRGF